MGLAERRAIKAFETSSYPALKGRIDEAAGFPVTVEVDWPTLAAEGYDHLYDSALPKVYFEPLIEALAAVAVDDMGRDALRDGLKKVVVRSSGSTDLSFSAGVLLLDHDPVSNIDYGHERRETLQKALERGL